MRCYDFPEVVLHVKGCLRYAGGTCHPQPTPTPPYTDEEAKVVADYQSFVHNGVFGRLVKPSGDTGALARRES